MVARVDTCARRLSDIVWVTGRQQHRPDALYVVAVADCDECLSCVNLMLG